MLKSTINIHQFNASQCMFVADFEPQDCKTNDRKYFSRSLVMQAGTKYHGDSRLHVKLYAAHKSNDSDRIDGSIEQ